MNKNFPHPFDDWMKTYRAEKKRLPVVVATEAQNFFKDSFRSQGFTGITFEKWKKRKGNKDAGRAILIKSAALRNSIRIKRADMNLIIVASDKIYSQVHNEGFRGTVTVKQHKRKKNSVFKIKQTSLKTKKSTTRKQKIQTGTATVKSHTRRMNIPKRQFMGDSPYLDARIERYITAIFLRTFK